MARAPTRLTTRHPSCHRLTNIADPHSRKPALETHERSSLWSDARPRAEAYQVLTLDLAKPRPDRSIRSQSSIMNSTCTRFPKVSPPGTQTFGNEKSHQSKC